MRKRKEVKGESEEGNVDSTWFSRTKVEASIIDKIREFACV